MCIGWIGAVDPRIAVAFGDVVFQKITCLALTIRHKGQTKIVVLTASFQQYEPLQYFPPDSQSSTASFPK